jgi:hypothetical protein
MEGQGSEIFCRDMETRDLLSAGLNGFYMSEMSQINHVMTHFIL